MGAAAVPGRGRPAQAAVRKREREQGRSSTSAQAPPIPSCALDSRPCRPPQCAGGPAQPPAPAVQVPPTFHSQKCTPEQLQQLNGYLDYLLEINQSMNLTGKERLLAARHKRAPALAWAGIPLPQRQPALASTSSSPTCLSILHRPPASSRCPHAAHRAAPCPRSRQGTRRGVAAPHRGLAGAAACH
jgi:hypothetical protein